MIPALLLAAVLAETELALPRPVSGIRYGLNAHRATQYRPRITPGDGAFLVTWGDYRGLVPTPPTYNFQPPVNGAAVRVGLDGKLLDASAIGLPVTPNAVVWNGEQWIVMSATHYVRIDRSGELLDLEARPMTTPIPAKGQFHAAAIGNSIIVGTSEPRDIENGRVVAVVHEANMRRIQQVTLLSPAYAGGEVLGVASDGETVMVLYRDQPRFSVSTVFPIRSAIFDRRGLLQSNAIVYEPTFNTEVSLGATDDGYMFIARTSQSAATYEAVFVGRNNEVQYKSAVFAAVENRTHFASAPTLAWDGTAFSFFTVWRSRTGPVDLFVTRMGGDGVPVGQPAKLMAWDSLLDLTALAAARHGEVTLLVTPAYADAIQGGERLLARAAADSTKLGEAPAVDLIVGAYPQETPAIASSNSQSLVVWRERTKLQSWLRPLFDVFAARVTDSGIALDLQPIPVATSSCNEIWPLVVSDGARFLVIWADGTNVNARQVGADGRLGQTRSIFVISDCNTARAMRMAAASNGTDTLLVWSSATSTATVRSVHGLRLGADGAPIGTLFTLGETRDGSAIPRVASDGNGWLVTFGDEAVRVASSGIVLAGFMTFGGDGQAEDVFWNGETYAAWVRYPSGEYRLFRVEQDGSSPGIGQPLPEPLPVPALAFAARDFWCERGVCLAPHGEQLLRVNADLRVDLIGAGLTPDRLGTAIGGTAAPLFVYLRRLSIRPFGGVARVYVQGSRSQSRGRAVRH